MILEDAQKSFCMMALLLGKSRETIIHVRVSTGTSGSFAGVRLTPLGGSGGGAINLILPGIRIPNTAKRMLRDSHPHNRLTTS